MASTTSARVKIAMALLLLLLMAISAATTAESKYDNYNDIPCTEVATKLAKCVEYAQHGGVLPAECCSGLKQLKAKAASTNDRRTLCNCIKSLAMKIGLNQNLVASIPKRCGVAIGYPISLSIDCSKVK